MKQTPAEFYAEKRNTNEKSKPQENKVTAPKRTPSKPRKPRN